jgi:hypothetical protein
VIEQRVITEALARALGLRLSSSGAIFGELYDAPLVLSTTVVQEVYGDGHVRPGRERLVLRAYLPFWPPLDLPLTVRPLARAPALQTAGRTSFRERFQIHDGGSARATSLLVPGVCEAANAAFIADPGIVIGPTSVTWAAEFPLPWPTIEELVPAILAAATTWSRVWEAGRDTPVPDGCEDAWIRLASLQVPEGVALRGCPFGLSGQTNGVRVGLVVSPLPVGDDRAPRFKTSVGIQFRTPLAGGVTVARETEFGWLNRIADAIRGRSEVLLGEEAFDDHFAVRTDNEVALRAELTQGVRTAMLALDAVAPLRMDSSRIAGTTPPGDLDQVVRAAEGLLALATAF